MTTYGVTATGFVRKSLVKIKEDLEAALKSAFGNNINLATTSVFGKLVGTLAQPASDLWELAEAVYNAMIPSSADGVSLEGCCDLIGMAKNAAVTSKVTVVVEGTVGTVIAADSKVATVTVGDQFESIDSATIDAAVAVRSNTALVGAVTDGKVYTITINGNPYTFTATVPTDDEDDVSAGLAVAINAGSDPVTATDLAGGLVQVDGDDDADGLPRPFALVVNANLSISTVGNLVAFESSVADAIIAYAGTLTEIVNQVGGWTAAWNPLDAVLGNPEETDAALRDRRTASLASPGAGTLDAIYASIVSIDAVIACVVIENTTDAVDANGLAPHSIHAVVEGGADANIAAALWARKGSGIALNGAESVAVNDSQEFSHTILFSRPTPVLMWVRATYTKYAEETFPDNGEATIATSCLATGTALSVGSDVLPDRFKGPVFSAVAGIGVLVIEIAVDDGFGAPGAYQSTPLAVAFTARATFDSGRITVVEA